MTDPHRAAAAPDAPGAPGTAPTWTSSAKESVGCALGGSRLWFTTGSGIVDEVYHPRVDLPQVRDMGFLVADGKGFWVEVKRLGNHEIVETEPGVPAVHVIHRHERFELSLRITADPERDVLLVELGLTGDESLRPYVLLAPRLGATGHGNRATTGDLHGRRLLWAEGGGHALALAAAGGALKDAFRRTSAGYVGTSDGWQDFSRNGALTWTNPRAGPGNVSLVGELARHCVLALAFAADRTSAANLAFSTLCRPFERAWRVQVAEWKAWHRRCEAACPVPPGLPGPVVAAFRRSAMVLRVHQDKTFPGALVASLSIPWGNAGDSRGGYHLVWPRDLVESAGALLALGGEHEARDVLAYLMATQRHDGRWNQNQWIGGAAYWNAVQLDETAFPVLLAAALDERGALQGVDVSEMVRRALAFIARTGPSSPQDRWEENSGVSTFTLAVCVAALVAGAPWLEPRARETALAIADFWNAQIESWTAAEDTPLARRVGVRTYYVRTAPPSALTEGPDPLRVHLPIKNQERDPDLPADEQVAMDFLQLVRFGLRRADDPAVLDSVAVADALLRVETPSGPSWRRYNGDGYGENEDGSPFDGAGIGRPWPLLTGERGHYELAAGRDPLPFLEAMVAMSGRGGLFPEQVWDGPPVPDRFLHPGRPSGSAMPLVWAHAEFVKLARSRELRRPFDRPEAVWERYRGERPRARKAFWTAAAPIRRAPAGAVLVVALREPAMVRWGIDGWSDVLDVETQPAGLGLHTAELPTADLAPGRTVDLTWRDRETGRWAGTDHRVEIVPS